MVSSFDFDPKIERVQGKHRIVLLEQIRKRSKGIE